MWSELAASKDTDELHNELIAMQRIAREILEGRGEWSRWYGHGAALCTRGLIFAEEIERRYPEAIGFRKFFIGTQPLMIALGERIEKPTEGQKGKRMSGRAAGSTHPLCCAGCLGRKGFTDLGRVWWVCASCRKPTEGWFAAQGDDVLNLFRDGALDGMVYTSSSVLKDARLTNLVLGYICTGEMVRSEITGKSARVWVYSSAQPSSVTQATPTATGRNKMTAPESQETAAPAVEAQPVDVSGILAKRKEIGVSRTPLATESGLTIATVARIENGGKRTTQAEVDQLDAALERLRAKQPAPAPAAEADGSSEVPAPPNPA